MNRRVRNVVFGLALVAIGLASHSFSTVVTGLNKAVSSYYEVESNVNSVVDR